MALYFEHVKLLSYSHSPILFEAGLRYRIEKKLTIEGRLADQSATKKATNIIAAQNSVIAAATDYEDILLNGISFGTGKIDNINFEGGTYVPSENYTYEITCYEDGNLFNATSGVYTDLSWANAKNIDALSEQFQFQENEKGDKSYSHSLNVRFCAYTSSAAGIASAKALAAVFFNATSGLGAFLTSYANLGSAKKLYTESYNVVDCSCSFSESALIPANQTGNYAYSLSYSLTLDEAGFVSITETCAIQGLNSPKFSGAQQGYTALNSGAYTRCNAVYTDYAFSSATLFNKLIQHGVSNNKFLGTIEITSVFSNDPKYQSTATWEYTLELQKDAEGYYTASENGRIRGYGRPLVDKYTNAKAFYDATVAAGVATRVQDFYDDNSGRSLTLIQVKHSSNKNEYEGTIEYSFAYTDNNLYSSGAIKKTEASVTVSRPVHLAQKYNIFNQKEIVQTQNQSTLGNVSVQVRYLGKRGTPISTFLTAAKAFALANQPAVSDVYIDSCQYSFAPDTAEFDFSLDFVYVGTHKSFTDLTID